LDLYLWKEKAIFSHYASSMKKKGPVVGLIK